MDYPQATSTLSGWLRSPALVNPTGLCAALLGTTTGDLIA